MCDIMIIEIQNRYSTVIITYSSFKNKNKEESIKPVNEKTSHSQLTEYTPGSVTNGYPQKVNNFS